jgi:RHS repeat-associated protein
MAGELVEVDRVGVRLSRVGLSALLAVTLVATMQQMPAAAAPTYSPVNSPDTPDQLWGSAADKSHRVAASATAPGKGAKAAPATKAARPKGAVPPLETHTPATRQRLSGSGVHRSPIVKAAPKRAVRGFNKATSVRRPDLGSATTSVFENADGTYTAEIHRIPVNRETADGGWVPDPSAQALTADAAAVTNPIGQRTTSDSTYVKSGVNQNFSTDNALYVGRQDGYNYNSFIKFDGFAGQFTNAYVLSAKLYLDTEYSGQGDFLQCDSTAVSVASVTSSWNPATLKTFPGPGTGAAIGTASWAGGINCPQGRVWGAVPLSPRTFTNWAHGWAPNNGLAVTAPYTTAAWKEFNPDDAYLSIEYAADGAGASYAETLYASPWNNKTGWANVTIQNEGSATWTPTNGYKLGYQIYTVANGVRTLYSTSNYLTAMPTNVPPNKPINVTATLPALAPGKTYQVCWDMVHNGQYFSGLGIPQTCYALDVTNNAPVIDSLMPYNNATQFTLTPTLWMTAHDVDAYPGVALTYTFNLYAAGSSTVLATSGSTTASTWVVPAGKLSWGATYYWTAQVSDTSKPSAWSSPAYFTVPAPAQPLVTTHLGAAPQDATVNGVSPAGGNYSTQALDASLPSPAVGPQLEIRRTYNSMDPRMANAFGAGWSTLLDTRVVPDADGTGNVVVILPDGREERFGRNGDGSYTAPPGSRERLTASIGTDASGNPYSFYTLLEPAGLRYVMNFDAADFVTGQQIARLNEISDADGHYARISRFHLDVQQVDGSTKDYELPAYFDIDPTDSGIDPDFDHGMKFEWSTGRVVTSAGTTVTVPHIAKVSVLQQYNRRVRDWTYGYDDANNLTSVCPPTTPTACTTYTYTSGPNSGSHFTSMVVDSNPKAYWRLNDAAGATKAADSVAVNVGAMDAALIDVTTAQPGALAGTPATSASFNGTSSKMVLTNDLVAGSNMSVGLWFKTTQAGGTLFSYQSKPAGTATTAGYTPALYIGTDGKLRGQFWGAAATPMTAPTAVNDGKWHHVVLSGAATAQTLFLDGAQVATKTGTFTTVTGQPYVTVGAGQLSGSWPSVPAGNPLGWFAGQIQDVSFLNRPLGLPAVQQEYTAATVPARVLTSSKRPSGKTAAILTYDTQNDRVASITAGDGGTFQFGRPVTTGSTDYYRGAVLSTRPTFGYPMNEASGTIARNLLGLDAPPDDPRDGVYSDVVLGTPGIFGDAGDTAASFNGTSAYLTLPPGAVDDSTGSASVALWFRTKTAGGVLFSYQRGAIGTTLTSNYTPALYIGNDGKLRGEFWDGHATPMASTSGVNDGNWHMVLLTASGTTQTLWVDGVSQATRTGSSIAGRVSSTGESTMSLGAGYIAGSWPAQQTGNPQGWFNGQIAQATLYALNIDQVTPGIAAALYQAKGSSMAPTPTTTVSITEPGGGNASVSLDPANGMRTTAVTNSLGQTTAYTFDTLGNQIGVTDPNGHTTSRVFDKNGNAIQRTTCQTPSSCQTSYDSFYWNMADLTDPRNGKILYSADGRAGTAGTGNAAYRTAYTYTPAGRLATVTTPPTPESPSGRTTTYTYTSAADTAVDHGNVPAGLVASTTDPRGQVTSYRYNHNGLPARVTEPSGQVSEYKYTLRETVATRTVTSDTYPDGLETGYTYDDQDRVLTERDPTTTDAVTGRRHTPYVTTEYDADGNIAAKLVADWGELIDTWVPDPDFPEGPLVAKVPVDGQIGLDPTRTTTYSYNAGDRLETVTDPIGHTTSYGYDAFGRNTTSTAADGAVYRYAFSPVGELLTTTLQDWTGDPAAPTAPTDLVIESRAYDQGGRLASITDAMGRTTAYTYFDDDRLQAITLAAGTTAAVVAARYTYDAAGNELTECTGWTPAAGCAKETQFTVDGANRITKTVTDPSGANLTVTRTYDPDDNVLSQTLTGGGQTRTVTYEYDAAGRRKSQKVPNGSDTLTTTTTYDQRGLPTSQTDPRGNAPGATAADFTTGYRYDEAGRQVAVTTPPVLTENTGGTAVSAVATSLTGYNTFGEQVELQTPTGKIQTNTYNDAGQLAVTAWPAYTPPDSTTTVTPTVQYNYDNLGQLLTLTDPLGNDQSFSYDQLGNTVTETLQDGRTTRTSYDTVGEVLSTMDATGARTEATYNPLGQQVTSTQIVRGTTPAAYTTVYGYDVAGNQSTVTDPFGKTTTGVYNAVGLLASQTDPLGHTTSYEYNLAGQPTKKTAADGTATVNAYDQAGRLTSINDLDTAGTSLRSVSYGYDLAGNLVSSTDPLHKTITADFDALNRTVRQIQPGSTGQTIVTSFGYDSDGNTTRYTDPNGNATTYTYNPLGLRESEMAPSVAGQTTAADRTTLTRYDAAGRLTSVTRPGNVTVTETYDKTGRLKTQSGAGADAATADRTFDYDGADRLISAAVPNGTEQFTYDDRGLMLTSSIANGWNALFAYDADGRTTSQTDPSGTTTYGYDDASRLTSQSDPLTGVTVTFGYNDVNLVTGVKYGTNAATRSYGYDDLHQLRSDIVKNPSGAVEASTTYGYDDGGHLTSKTTAGFAGAGSNTYSYDDAGRLASWTAGAMTAPYTYDPAGNLTRAGPTTYVYNARSELTSATAGSNTTTYSYTSRGTTAAITSGTGTTAVTSDAYDEQITAGSTSYSYDALGRLAGTTGAAGSHAFSYDDLTNNVVSDGGDTFNYTPGDTLLSTSRGGAGSFISLDHHGDVTATFTAAAASLVSSATYDPYGNVLASSGSRPNVGYQSGWTDPTTNFVNAASRWYNPATESFTSADTQENAPSPAVNANPYAYGNDDPLGHSDPSGHDACGDVLKRAAAWAAQEAARKAWERGTWARMLAQANADRIRYLAEVSARQRQNAAEEAARQARLKAESRAFNESIERDLRNFGNSSYDRQRAADRSSASGSSQARSNQNSHVSSGGWSITINSWGIAAAGVGLIAVVGLVALVGPEAAVVGAGAAALGVAADYALAASDSLDCTAANAPARPKDKAPDRSKGPAVATGPAKTADIADPNLPASLLSPAEAPTADTLSTPAQAQLDNACFSGALQRSDGSRSAGVWECDDDSPVPGQFWRRIDYNGQRVYQRDDLVNPGYFSPADPYGRSNLKRMKQGLAPMGPDDKPLNLHHMLQTQDGPIAEITHSMHFGYYGQLHWKSGTKIPSGIDRPSFESWKTRYWIQRAVGFDE